MVSSRCSIACGRVRPPARLVRCPAMLKGPPPPAVVPVVPDAGSWRRALVPVVPRTGLWWPVVACFALAAISLLEPSAPTYDPWAWIICGREVMHLDLDTVSGPSWKPLPVMLTAPFSLLGDDVAPALWLVVARAGSLGALIVTYRLAARVAGAAAGLLAALLLLASPWLVRNA